MYPSDNVEVLTMPEIEARGWLKVQDTTVIQYHGAELSPGASFPTALLETALELCRNYISQGQHCLIVAESILVTVWRGTPQPPEEAVPDAFIPAVTLPASPVEDLVQPLPTFQAEANPQPETRYIMYRGTKIPLENPTPREPVERVASKPRTYRGREYS